MSWVTIGWTLFLVTVTILAVGIYFGRERLIAAVPATAELYKMIGLDPTPPLGAGLEFRDVKSVRRLVDGERVVVIEGVIANVSEVTRPVPTLRARLSDADGALLDEWTFTAGAKFLPPGGVTSFKTSTRNVPREANLSIDFVAKP